YHSALYTTDLPRARVHQYKHGISFRNKKRPKKQNLDTIKRRNPQKQHRVHHVPRTSVDGARAILSGGFRRSSEGMLGPGVYVSRDIDKAKAYPQNVPHDDRVVLELQVNVGRVKKIDRQNHPLQKAWRFAGYDTAWVPPNCGMVPSGLEEECVWDPNRLTVIRVVQAPLYFWYAPPAGVSMPSGVRRVPRYLEYAPAADVSMPSGVRRVPRYLEYAPAADVSMPSGVRRVPQYFGYAPPADVSMPSGVRRVPRHLGYAPPADVSMPPGVRRDPPYFGSVPPVMSMGQWVRSAPYFGYVPTADMSMGQWVRIAPYF
ncbi:uncharacterized protein LOC116943555, partial [Petromyzon marinus]|uniref:uncharacterized protein LOC116943555 n=1 Tax=Petromyzon marinus TaxID=7757 RepID=UPI003F6F0ADD